MTERDDSLTRKTFPWFRGGFDLEGIVGFLAAWLLGVLLGMVWGPLFWIAFIPGVILLFATRTAERVTSDDSDQLVAPCDGVIVSVEEADAPDDLRMSGPCVRIRISSSPFSANNIHAPIAGAIDRVDRLEGEPRAFAAMQPDTEGLARLFVAFAGEGLRVGLAVATGGLGPRLEVKSDAGDRVRKGRTVATRRLGGWCDLYLPADVDGAAVIQPGRILVGGETVVWDFSKAPRPMTASEPPVSETAPMAEPATDVPGAVPASVVPAAAATQQPETAAPEEVGAEPAPPEPVQKDPVPDTSPAQNTGRGLQAGQPHFGNEETPASEYDPYDLPEDAPHDPAEDVSWLSPPAPDAPITPEVVPPEVASGGAHDPQDGQPEPTPSSTEDDDAASMFERLRREARKLSGEDDGNAR